MKIGTETQKFIVGSVIIIGMLALCGAIAMGKVEEKSSFGLTGIIGILGKVTLDFSEWAFRREGVGEGKVEKEIKGPDETNKS